MNDDIGLQCFRTVFLAHCGSARPQLLILDSHHSLELAQKEDVHVMALPPHKTHAVQPLDEVVFKSFKTAYKIKRNPRESPQFDHKQSEMAETVKTNLGLGDEGGPPQEGI